MINGAHVVLYSADAEADRRFLAETLGFPHVDVGHGWLIFALPKAEAAVHPAETNGGHTLFLMCDDLQATIDDLAGKGCVCGPVSEQRWGLLTEVPLPGGGKLGLYQPRHARP